MSRKDRWRAGRSDLWVFGLLLILVLWNVLGIVVDARDPFTVTLRNFEPWKSHFRAEDAARPEIIIDDPVSQNYAWVTYAHECLEKGDFPLWNPKMFSGTPFTANRLTGFFNPLVSLLAWLLPPTAALAFFYSIHHVLAGWFMYLFLKGLGIRRPAALFGAIAYMLQGAYMPWLGVIVSQNAYFPMTFYYLQRVCDRRDRPGVLGFIISFALLGITGYPQMVLFALCLTSAWVLFTCGPGFRRAFHRQLGLIVMLVMAFLLGAMQHLPMIEFFQHSLRILPEFQSHFGSLVHAEKYDSPLTVLAMFFPKLWGDYLSDFPTSLPRDVLALRNHAYIGIIAAFGALFAPLVWRNRHARFFTVLYLLGWLIVSWNAFYLMVVSILPGIRISQGKPYFLTVTSMIIVAAFVLDYLLCNLRLDRALARRLSGMYVLLLGTTLGLAVVYITTLVIPGYLPKEYAAGLKSIVAGITILSLAMTFLFLHAQRGLAIRWVIVGIIILELIDLVPYHGHFNPLVPKGRAAFVTPSIEFLQGRMAEEGPFRIFRDRHRVFRPNAPMIFGLDDMGGFDSFVSADYMNFFRTIDPSMVRDSRYVEMPDDRATFQEPFWSFLGVRYLLSSDPISYLPASWREAWTGEIFIYENTSWLPRWFLVPTIIPVETIQDGYSVARTIHPKREAVVVDIDGPEIPPALLEEYIPSEEARPASSNLLPKGPEDSRVGVLESRFYGADELRLMARCERDCFLVFSDSYFPAWRAWVDGKEVTVYRTDGVVKGIVVPAGNHVVRFLYDPPLYKLGWLLTLIGVVLMLILSKPMTKLFE